MKIMKIIKQNTVVLCSLLFILFTVVDTAAGDERVSRPESAEEVRDVATQVVSRLMRMVAR